MLTSAAVMRLMILVAATVLTGCTALAPAAERLYPAHAASDDRMPVILIPGLLGSRLARASDGVELWPGSTRKLLTSDFTDLALRIDPETLEPIDDGLVPAAIFEAAVGKDFYQRINGKYANVYDGVVEGLVRLQASGLKLACLTNKPLAFARTCTWPNCQL